MSYQQVPEGDVSITSEIPKEKNWKKEIIPSSNDMIVYEYDINSNKYKPYMAEGIKLGEDYPHHKINKMFEEISENLPRPPKINRVLYGKMR